MSGGTIRVGISSCLLGNRVRYDGDHKLNLTLRDTLGALVEWVPVCPEVESGLPTPREALRLAGDPAAPRLVAIRSGADHTKGMKSWALRRLGDLDREGISGFIFKSRSPSSGLRQIEVYDEAGSLHASTGVGVFARLFMEHFPLLPVEDDHSLGDPALRGRFVERLLLAARMHPRPRHLLPRGLV